MFYDSRRNLARWFTLSMGSILVVYTGAIYYQKITDELEALDRLLYKKAALMAASVQYEMIEGRLQIDLDNVPLLGNNPQALSTEIVYARWYDPKGQLLQFYGMPPKKQLIVANEFVTIKTTPVRMGRRLKGEWLRQVTLPVQYKGIAIGHLQIASPIIPVKEKLREFLLLLTLCVPATLGIIGIGGWILAGLAMQPIRQAYDQLQRFTSNASHELRTPLAAVLSNAQVGLLVPLEPEQQHHYLEQIVAAAKSMSTLVSNLLLLARHSGRLARESLKEVDLTSLLHELADFYTAQAAEKQLSLKRDLPQLAVKLIAEPDLVRQAVVNLLSNACKYTPTGGTVKLRLFTHYHWAVIQVSDSGVGIAQADLSHIFERFYRVDTKQSHSAGGFGLGLAIAKQVVAAHGGQIKVTSVVGSGSTFQIELPLRRCER
ncbi:MAG TPA: two-component sensor histidine kinase [Cyanobacteria bacterium UBA8803]|nr:two-component sensor histidine kinase [Cyanobacteria bacterium UBA9273]HBL58703.1 two-component sensor histidine kinase [Cyanobacteria bacterium UBA8803]